MKTKRLCAFVLTLSMILGISSQALAATSTSVAVSPSSQTAVLRNKPYDNTTFTIGANTKSYPLDISVEEPCIRVWAENTDTQGSLVVRLVNEDGTSKGTTVTLGPGEQDWFDVSYYGDSDTTWYIEVSKMSSGVSKVTGRFAARMESSWTKFE